MANITKARLNATGKQIILEVVDDATGVQNAAYGVVTIEMKTSFMRPAPGDGSPLTGRGRLMQRTTSMAFTEATLYDSRGQACAHATSTFKYVQRDASKGHAASISTD